MKEFLWSLIFMFVISFAIWLGTHFTEVAPVNQVQGEPSIDEVSSAADTELKDILAIANSTSSNTADSAQEIIALEPSINIGEEIYNLSGANSCVYCHGVGGVGGNVANAAKLNNPSSWKITKILGGEIDSEKFKDATVKLIAKGALVHNSTYKKEASWFDTQKAGGSYDSQMVGLTGAPSAKYLKDNSSKGVTPEVAAQSVYLYIRSF